MDFIAISPNVLINPDKITSIEKRTELDGRENIYIITEWKEYLVTIGFGELYSKLLNTGKNQIEQFFAG